MRLPEQRSWDRLRKALKGTGILYNRVENAVGKGDPDIELLYEGRLIKVELKVREKGPAYPYTPVLGQKYGLSIDQRNFHRRWWEHGGESLILVTLGYRYEVQHYAFSGEDADEVNNWVRTDFVRNAVAYGYDELINYVKIKR